MINNDRVQILLELPYFTTYHWVLLKNTPGEKVMIPCFSFRATTEGSILINSTETI